MVKAIQSVIVARSPGDFMNAVPTPRKEHAKTSTEVLRERDELRARVTILEAVLHAIGKETGHALRHPRISLTTLCRIEALVRQSEVEPDLEAPPPVSELRPLRRA
jgi:hypothetical protein